jgi:hypothetical protein
MLNARREPFRTGEDRLGGVAPYQAVASAEHERSARNLGSPDHQSAAIADVTLTHRFLPAFQSNSAP